MKQRTDELFVQYLSDFCRNIRSAEPASDTVLNELMQLSEAHSLAGIVYAQFQRSVAMTPAQHRFHQYFLMDAFYSVNRCFLLREIAREFLASGISFICMKGAVFRDYYPVPELRSMGDVDLIIHLEDIKEADRIMTEVLGYRRFVDHQSVWTYILDQFQFEIHNQMFYENLTNHVDYISYFNKVWEHCHLAPVFGVESPNMYVPDEDFHFLYLMTHTAKHVINSGSGFRAYLDMVMMTRSCKDTLDWHHIEEELKTLKLLEFTKVCFSCCEKWFDIEMPLKKKALDEKLFREITEKTLKDGIFGFDNAENKPAASAKYIRRSTAPYTAAAIGKGIKKIFPPYEDLQLVPWYSFIDGRPWLLPVAWAYRWGYCIIKKLRHSIDLLTEPFTRKKDVLDREALIGKWGL